MHKNIYVNALENPFNTKIPAIINKIPIISTNANFSPKNIEPANATSAIPKPDQIE